MDSVNIHNKNKNNHYVDDHVDEDGGSMLMLIERSLSLLSPFFLCIREGLLYMLLGIAMSVIWMTMFQYYFTNNSKSTSVSTRTLALKSIPRNHYYFHEQVNQPTRQRRLQSMLDVPNANANLNSDSSLAAATTTTTRREGGIDGSTQRQLQFVLTLSLWAGDTHGTNEKHGDYSIQDTLTDIVMNSTMFQQLTSTTTTTTRTNTSSSLSTLTSPFSNLMLELQTLLYAYPTSKSQSIGLFNAHCQPQSSKPQELMDEIIALLPKIQEEAFISASASTSTSISVLRIPVNMAIYGKHDVKDERDSHASRDHFWAVPTPSLPYALPTGKGKMKSSIDCYKNDFPSLDLWYEICQEARVDCRHVYVSTTGITSDSMTSVSSGGNNPLTPDKDIKTNNSTSTTSTSTYILQRVMKNFIHHHEQKKKKKKREPRFADHLAIIHLYNTMLHILTNEMTRFGSNTLACIAATPIPIPMMLSSSHTMSSSWQQQYASLWCLSTHNEHDSMQNDTRPLAAASSPNHFERSLKVLPPIVEPYLKSFVRLHQHAYQVCQDSLKLSEG